MNMATAIFFFNALRTEVWRVIRKAGMQRWLYAATTLCLFTAAAQAQPSPPVGVGTHISVSTRRIPGPGCHTLIRFKGEINLEGHAAAGVPVRYRYVRDDGVEGPEREVMLSDAHRYAPVFDQWETRSELEGWEAIKISSINGRPVNEESVHGRFVVCAPKSAAASGSPAPRMDHAPQRAGTYPLLATSLTPEPRTYSGACNPVKIVVFRGVIERVEVRNPNGTDSDRNTATEAPVRVAYRFIHSDRAASPIIIADLQPHSRISVHDSWNLARSLTGWEQVVILSENGIPVNRRSNHAVFVLRCVNPPAANPG